MDYHPESEPDVGGEVEDMEQQTLSTSAGLGPRKVLPGGSEQIRECANSADYDPSQTPSHGSKPSPLEATTTPPRAAPEPCKLPTATLWDTKTGKQIYTPPKTSPVGKGKGPNPPKHPPKTPKAPTTPAFPGPKLGTFYPSGKPTIQALYPTKDSEVGPAQKGDESDQENREDSQKTDIIEALIKDIQQPLEGIKLDTLEPDSRVSRDQAMVGSTHAAQAVALLNSPGKRKGQSTGQPAEPVRARHTTEELEAARGLPEGDMVDGGVRE